MGQYEIWFRISQRKVRFLNEEFCLVTDLKFGRSSSIDTDGNVPIRNGIHKRYLPMMDVDMTALHHKLTDPDVGFQQPLDAVRMTLILFAKTFLFESEYKENVSS